MNKYYICLTTLLMMVCILFAPQTKAKDIFFIQQDKFDAWSLSKTYNDVWITSIKGRDPISVEIKPYGYSVTLIATLDQSKKLNPTLEIDVGNFTSELTRIDNSNSYKVIFNSMNSLQFINAIKKNNTLIFYNDDQTNLTVSLKGMKEALDQMEAFAKDHYILLPQPFSSKIDIVSTMAIPNTIPANLYPIFRQQASLNNACTQNKDDTSKKEACSQYKIVMDLLKEAGFCKQEQIQPAQSYISPKVVSYQWIQCPASK